jgi:dihydrofolate reductase
MRPLVVNAFVTLDGVMQSPGGPDEDPSGGFTQGGWGVTQWDDVMGRKMDEVLRHPFDLLLGRRTYEIFAAHWPHVTETVREERGGHASPLDDPAARALNGAKKYVASRTLKSVDWNNSTLLKGDVAEAVAKLKQQAGPEIQVHGSANLLQTLIRHQLIDRYQLWIFPVVVGNGKRLFADGTVPGGLQLLDATTSTTGVVMATYEPAGGVPRGSFEFDEPTAAEVERRQKLAAEIPS